MPACPPAPVPSSRRGTAGRVTLSLPLSLSLTYTHTLSPILSLSHPHQGPARPTRRLPLGQLPLPVLRPARQHGRKRPHPGELPCQPNLYHPPPTTHSSYRSHSQASPTPISASLPVYQPSTHHPPPTTHHPPPTTAAAYNPLKPTTHSPVLSHRPSRLSDKYLRCESECRGRRKRAPLQPFYGGGGEGGEGRRGGGGRNWAATRALRTLEDRR